MIQRVFLLVEGPSGAGKTAFVEALLPHLDSCVLCVRGIRDDALTEPVASVPRSHQELGRYRRAGASDAVLYRFSGAEHAAQDDFFDADFMQEYATVVVTEGDCPLEHVDLRVFVAPTLPPGNTLLRRVQQEPAPASAALWEQITASPEAFAQGMADLLGNAAFGEMALRHADVLEDARKAAIAAIGDTRPPKSSERWAVAPGYEGIERAQLVVVNTPQPHSTQKTDLLLQDITRLRRDKAVFEDVVRPRGNKRPITAVSADLVALGDPGLKKALTRVRRAFEQVD